MAPPRPAAGGSIPPDPAAARPEAAESEGKLRQGAADTMWLQALSEPELDVLLSLREVAVTRATNAGHPALADTVFHLRALRALGIVLVEELKERLRQSSANTKALDRLALLSDPEAEAVRPSQDHQMPVPTRIHKKRKQRQVQDGWEGEGAQTPKRRKAKRVVTSSLRIYKADAIADQVEAANSTEAA